MTLTTGSQLGPYEVLAPLGSGGMGEVYRAKDVRLEREVAVKILPESLARNEDRLRRFELEAKATSGLNHPNILAIYDIGTHEGSPYVVSELLDGETLREQLEDGPPAPHRALDYASQVALGLAAAHEKGVIHRDLKPDNLFLTRDGRVKILDFGLAKLTHKEEDGSEGPEAPTLTRATHPGTVMGTVGYMSPEQVRGKLADHRSDIFSFGAVLYEMLTGQRAFKGESAVETMNAILKEEPQELTQTARNLPLGVDRVVRRCLEKRPEDRFQSTRDLAFDLEALSGITTSAVRSGTRFRFRASPRTRRRLTIGLALVVMVAAFVAGHRIGLKPTPSFERLTFRRGAVASARFAPDTGTFLYSAEWEGRPREAFSGRLDSPDARPLELEGARLQAVSSTGEMAITLPKQDAAGNTLARVSLGGGSPREILENVMAADWTADGSAFAVSRFFEGRNRLEYPIGTVLYEAQATISHPRISPSGEHVAFIDHPLFGDDRGSIVVVDQGGGKTTLSEGWASAEGLAWSPDGEEVWFTAARQGALSELWAVSLSGDLRQLANAPGRLVLHDVAPDGRVLMAQDNIRTGMIVLPPGEVAERDLSWHDFSFASDLSPDGQWLLFSESGEAGGAGYGVYLRRTDGAPAVRLGEGRPMGLSPDGKWAITIPLDGPPTIVLLPTGPGETRRVALPSFEQLQFAGWFPDGKRLLLLASKSGNDLCLYELDLAGGEPRPVAPERITVNANTISPDGQSLIVMDATGNTPRFDLLKLDSAEREPVPGLTPFHFPLGWSGDGRYLYAAADGGMPFKIYRVDTHTGEETLWRELTPADPAGVRGIGSVRITPDGASYVYNFRRTLSELYLVEGVE